MRRIKILGMVVLITLSLCLPSVQGLITKEPVTIYNTIITVDNEGDGDYTSIKEALNNAKPGDTIEVYSGTYYENGINVEKERITFQGVSYELGSGNDTGKPFIDGEGMNDVFLFKAKNATLDGFHIENGGNPTLQDLLIIESNGCTISNNDLFHSTSTIIWVEDSNNNNILNNNIAYSDYFYGIGFYMTSSYNLISNNNISNVQDGIKLWDSDHNTVTGNRVSKCSRFAIDVASDGNYIEGNSIENNSDGVHIYGGSNNHIEGNSIKDNYVGVHMVVGFNNHIKNNNFINNEKHVFFIFGFPFIISIITNGFDGNYWDDWIGFGPKLIHGALLFIPWVKMDWHPTKEPYDI
jgi:nitrous oxidase accessory protein